MSSEERLVRLQKHIAACGVASRRAAEELILRGKVSVNGEVIKELGHKIDPQRDNVVANGRKLIKVPLGVLLFHKPRHVVTTKNDPQGRVTVFDLVPREFSSYFPVGRLDFDASGLIVLTNDGDLSQRLAHPRFGVERVYEAVVRGVVEDKALRRLERGVRLEDGMAKAMVQKLKTTGKVTTVRIAVCEGRNHIVKRMMEKVRHPVLELKRVAHGPLKLGKLARGEVRRLSRDEYHRLKETVEKSTPFSH